MAFLLKNRVVFIHVPKTAGSWVVSCLKELNLIEMKLGPEHADYERIFNFSGHYLGAYLKKSCLLKCSVDSYLRECRAFAFVREPVSYYESWWRFMQDVDWKRFSKDKNYSRFKLKADLWHPYAQMEPWGALPFNEFIERLIQESPGFLSNLYEKYIPYDSKVIIGKQENLLKDMNRILQELYGRSYEKEINGVPKVNASKAPKPEWDPKLKKELVKLEYAAYRRFGYEIPIDSPKM